MIEIQVENLNELLAANEAREAVGDDDWADRAALDLSAGFERLRRYQSAKTRELQRTLETLCKLRKGEFGKADGEAIKDDGEGQMAGGECQVAEGELVVSDERCEVEYEVGGCDEGQRGELTTAGSSGPVGTDPAGQPGQGDAVGQCLPGDVTAPQKAANEAAPSQNALTRG